MKRAVLLALLISACAAGNSDTRSGSNDAAVGGISPQAALRPMSDVIYPDGYYQWRQNFRARATANGISPQIFDAMFEGTGINTDVLAKDRNQAEFKKTIWEYVDAGTRSQRVALGRQMASRYAGVLSQIEARYGVDRRAVLGIWGMETNYGKRLGNIPVAESLATLAYDGRRKSFAEEQLMAALKIAQRGDAPPKQMLGSWAGAMGQTQFIPTSYMAYAQDFEGDGHRNLWQIPDALASTANYLKRSGWVSGQPWGIEVIAPGINGGSNSADGWASRGVKRASGGSIPPGSSRLYAPAGENGPKFLLYKNFDVIKRYNNSDSYALAVGHLGDLVTGGSEFVASWPWGENQLRSNEVLALQKALASRGYTIEKIDGLMGDETRAAIAAYQRANGLAVTGQPSRSLLNSLR